jgi:poly(3-hydroxybutyrate) depolymerase
MPYVSIPGRSYYYAKYAAPSPQAIVIGYHGAFSSGLVFAGQSKLHLRGAAAVFAYPSGYWTTWDSRIGSPDVAMTAALIAKLWQAHGQLPVYVTGISAGASMAYRAATECDVEKLAAVAAGLNPTEASHVPVSALHMHGDVDPIVPYDTYQPSIPAGIELLRSRGCPVDLRLVSAGVHEWDFGVGRDTSGEILTAWGL